MRALRPIILVVERFVGGERGRGGVCDVYNRNDVRGGGRGLSDEVQVAVLPLDASSARSCG